MPDSPRRGSDGAAAVPYTPLPFAERWDVRLARARLHSATGLADIDHDLAAADGFSVGPHHDRVLVLYAQEFSFAVPRRRAFRGRWDAALSSIQEVLEDAGFAELRRTAKSVSGRAPVPVEPQTTARLHPASRKQGSTARVSFDGYDRVAVGGTLAVLGNRDQRAVTAVADAGGNRIGSGHRDRDHAVRCLADHYGLPAPVRVLHAPELRP